MNELKITSTDFCEGGWIPVKNTGRGEDISPCFKLSGIVPEAKTIAITLDDSSHPIFPNYNHWIIWNIPVQSTIPAYIPKGETVLSLGGAVQGIAYGKNQYKGPKPPFKWMIHTYVFTIYILDCKLSLSPKSRKKDLILNMEGHVLQKSSISGKFQSGRK